MTPLPLPFADWLLMIAIVMFAIVCGEVIDTFFIKRRLSRCRHIAPLHPTRTPAKDAR